jgi:hypothetical protein
MLALEKLSEAIACCRGFRQRSADRPENQDCFSLNGGVAALLDVVNHYSIHLNLRLCDQEKRGLVEYLISRQPKK